MPQNKRVITNLPGYVTYLRTSSEEVQAPERSQDAQIRDIQARLAAFCNLPDLGEYRDNYTGTSADRREYQRLLTHARQGKFSHVFTATPDRFGRDDVEALRAIDEMTAIGIQVRFATHPDLDPSDPDDRLYLNILFGMARRESQIIGKRVIGGMLSKLLKGDWPFLAPDGYRNREIRLTEIGDLTREKYLRHARYKRWVEQDPERSPIWRYAWDLLLQGNVSLEDICEALAARGYRLRNGTPFIYKNSYGKHQYHLSTLSRIFHNWFYAGWIVVENGMTSILPKTLRGNWEPIVNTEEFEAGLAILATRDRKPMPKKKNFYLLQGILYLEKVDGEQIKLTCSRPNLRRTPNGTTYYCIPSSSTNFPCDMIDSQVIEHLRACQVAPERIPEIRKACVTDLNRVVFRHVRDEANLSRALERAKEKELNLWRAFTEFGMQAEHYAKLAREYQDEQNRIQFALTAIQRENKDRITNLDAALAIIAEIGDRFVRQSPPQQREILRHMISRVIVNQEGRVLRLDFVPPFTYLRQMLDREGDGALQPLTRRGLEKKTSDSVAGCSLHIPQCVPGGIRTPGPLLRRQMLYPLSYRHILRVIVAPLPEGVKIEFDPVHASRLTFQAQTRRGILK